MIVKHFKLSQPEKDRLIRIKAKTGIQNWNVLCRWALCWSLAEPSIPGGVDPLSDSNVEMDWSMLLHAVLNAVIISGKAAVQRVAGTVNGFHCVGTAGVHMVKVCIPFSDDRFPH